MYNYTSYPAKFRWFIGRPETVKEASDRYDKEKQHSLEHWSFCRASICVWHGRY